MTVHQRTAVFALALAALAACFTTGLAAVLTAIIPRWNGTFLVLAIPVIVAVVFVRARKGMAPGRVRSGRARLMRYAEPALDVLFLVGLQAALNPPLHAGLVILLLVLALLARALGKGAATLYEDLTGGRDRVPGYADPGRRLQMSLVLGGIVLLVLVAVRQPDYLTSLGLSSPPLPPGPVLDLFGYVAVALLLIAWTQYGLRRTGWRERGAVVRPRVRTLWAVALLAVVGLAAMLAFLAPSDLGQPIFHPPYKVRRISLGHVNCHRHPRPAACGPHYGSGGLSFKRGHGKGAKQRTHRKSNGTRASASKGVSPWLGVVVALALATLGTLYLLAIGGSRRARLVWQVREALQLLTRFLLQLLARIIPALRGVAARIDSASASHTQAGRTRDFAHDPSHGHREQILRAYASVLRRARREGISVRSSSTAQETQMTLVRAVPDAGADVRALTGAFREARYSPHTIDRDDVRQAREWSGRIKRALRRRPKDA